MRVDEVFVVGPVTFTIVQQERWERVVFFLADVHQGRPDVNQLRGRGIVRFLGNGWPSLE